MSGLSGVWLPIVTPFLDGAVDYASYERLLEHYLAGGSAGSFHSAPLAKAGPLRDMKPRLSSIAPWQSLQPVFRSWSASAATRPPRCSRRSSVRTLCLYRDRLGVSVLQSADPRGHA